MINGGIIGKKNRIFRKSEKGIYKLSDLSSSDPQDGSTYELAADSPKTDVIKGKPSGWFWIKNSSGFPQQTYIDNSTDGGGWVELISIPSWINLGNFHWGNTDFWIKNNMVGSPIQNSNIHYNGIFKSWAFSGYSGWTEIMIQVYNSSGTIIAWGKYSLSGTYAGLSWQSIVGDGARKIISGTRTAQSGDSGAGHNNPQSTVYGFPFTDTGKPGCAGNEIVVNDTDARFSATQNYVRIGTNFYSDAPTNRGHLVSAGFGVYHFYNTWYGAQAVGPHFDYCVNSGSGQANRAWGTAGVASNNTGNFYGAANWAYATNCFTANANYPSYGARIMVR